MKLPATAVENSANFATKLYFYLVIGVNMKKNISGVFITEILMYILIFGFIIYSKLQSLISYEAFYAVVKEDGWVEYLTTIFLLMGAIVFGVYAVRSVKAGDHKKTFFYVLAAAVFFFGMGEEISWGQRIFGVQSSEYFVEHNFQKETNLHNLVIWGIDLNRLIFSKLMFIGLVLYFVFLFLMTWKIKFIRKLVVDFGVPVPKFHHTLILVLSNILVTTIDMVKESELHELALTGILFLVFINSMKSFRGVSFVSETDK